MTQPLRSAPLKRIALIGAAATVVGTAICATAYTGMREQLLSVYLTALFFWLDITLGCLGLALLHNLTGGGWGTAIRRVLEAGYQTLPWMALAFVPLWFNVERIYLWTDPGFVARHESVLRKARYLNVDGWQLRAVAYFGAWIAVSILLNVTAPRGDTTPYSPRTQRMQPIGGLGFVAYGVTITLAAVDWVMSLEPTWFSTMYGVLYMAGEAVSGLAFAVLVVSQLGGHEPWATAVTSDRRNDLGNLLLAFVMFWAYVQFMQFLIIWSGNLPEENVWYLRRGIGPWAYVVPALVAFHFAAPFLLLLARRQKRDAGRIAWIAAMLLVMRYINLLWMIVPGFAEKMPSPSYDGAWWWLGSGAWAAIGGGWIAVFAWRLSARAAVPIFDPELAEEGHEHAHRPAES